MHDACRSMGKCRQVVRQIQKSATDPLQIHNEPACNMWQIVQEIVIQIHNISKYWSLSFSHRVRPIETDRMEHFWLPDGSPSSFYD